MTLADLVDLCAIVTSSQRTLDELLSPGVNVSNNFWGGNRAYGCGCFVDDAGRIRAIGGTLGSRAEVFIERKSKTVLVLAINSLPEQRTQDPFPVLPGLAAKLIPACAPSLPLQKTRCDDAPIASFVGTYERFAARLTFEVADGRILAKFASRMRAGRPPQQFLLSRRPSSPPYEFLGESELETFRNVTFLDENGDGRITHVRLNQKLFKKLI
jgi:hypothetical protein